MKGDQLKWWLDVATLSGIAMIAAMAIAGC